LRNIESDNGFIAETAGSAMQNFRTDTGQVTTATET
jgi:hypothetical protein